MQNLLGDEAAAAPALRGRRACISTARPRRGRAARWAMSPASRPRTAREAAPRPVAVRRGRSMTAALGRRRSRRLLLWSTPIRARTATSGARRAAAPSAAPSLTANLRREVREETGLEIEPGRLLARIGVPQPRGPASTRSTLIFRARLAGPAAAATLRDPEGVVNRLRWADEAELAACASSRTASRARLRAAAVLDDPLEVLVRSRAVQPGCRGVGGAPTGASHGADGGGRERRAVVHRRSNRDAPARASAETRLPTERRAGKRRGERWAQA